MSKKKKKKTKDYEGYQYGPFRIERHGRYNIMSSHWKPGEYEKYIESVKSHRSELEISINKKIQVLLILIEENDPLELLTVISNQNCMGDPEQYRETTYEGRECYVEYALKIITGHNKHGFGNHATGEAITQFNELISDIFTEVMKYYATEFTGKQRDCLEEELRYLSILRHLFIRGASYPEYHLDLIKDLFKPHDGFLKQHYGIITENVIAGILEIENQIENIVSSQ